MENLNYITEVDILDESKENFLIYAEEVLTDRAIPSAEDGLLSVHRKLLWTMEDCLNMDSSSKYKKSASIVGTTLATSYYHGDSACYGAMCKIAQPYLMRYPLVDGDGNLGSQEANGMEAASRYTNARPSKYADLMMKDYNKNVVMTKPTYNNEYLEPVVLPSFFPNAIVNGRESIGISMSHNSLPHNLTEVCNALIAYIKGDIKNTDDLMKYIKGPDFPLGGTITNGKDILYALATGHSQNSLKVRGDYEIKGQTITFTSIPYRTYRNKIKEQINENIEVFENFISDFNDESSVGNNKLVFEVKRGVSPLRALNKLFELTDLETTLSYNMNFIVNGTPKMCSMIDLIVAYYEHQTNVFLKATEFDKEKAEARKHIIEGLLKAINQIDEVIKLIKESDDKTDANNKLMLLLEIDKIQANAILDMKLSRLTQLDNQELIKESHEKELIIIECDKIINNKEYRDNKLIEQIEELKSKYGDNRKTIITNIEITKEEKEIAHVEPEKVVVVMTKSGNIKRIPATSFKEQNRNTKGVKLQKDDITDAIIRTNTVDNLLLFTNKGKVYKLLVDNIPVGTNTSTGTNVNNLIEFEENEEVSVIYSLYRESKAKFVLFVTTNGLMKKVPIEDFTSMRKRCGVQAIKFNDGDSLAAVSLLNDEELLIITEQSYVIRINSNFDYSSRAAKGIKGINLGEGDRVITALPIREKTDTLAIFNNKGLAKRVDLSELNLQNRGGKGLKINKTNILTNAATLVDETDSLLLTGTTNSICISAKDIPLLSRTASGNSMIKDDVVIQITKI